MDTYSHVYEYHQMFEATVQTTMDTVIDVLLIHRKENGKPIISQNYFY